MDYTKLFAFLENGTHSKYKDYYKINYSVPENHAQDINHNTKMYEEISITVVYSVFCLLGIIGNGLVIWFSIFRMKKTVNVIWFLSLSVSDFSFASFLPLNYTQLLFGFEGFTNMCKLIHYLMYVNVGVSIVQLTVISIDRCICAMFPVWCHNHRRPRLAFIIVLIIWITSFSGSFAAIIYSEMIYCNGKMMCAVYTDHYRLMRKTILEFVFFFLLPFIVIVSSYIMFFLHIRSKPIIRSSRPLKTSVAVIIAFFICWFPHHLFSLLILGNLLNYYMHQYIYFSTTLLIAMSCCINPILYVFIGRDFRKTICGSFQSKLEQAFIEEDKLVCRQQTSCPALQMSPQDHEEEVKEVIGEQHSEKSFL